MKTLILDNYDSFTFNLLHLAEQFTDEIEVYRNDEIELQEIAKFDKVIISPGPGLPESAGITLELIKEYASSTSILGVCLGMQALAIAFGGKLKNLDEVKHGIESECIVMNGDPLFSNISNPFKVAHYHSWIIDPDHLPDKFDIIAKNDEGLIMGISHKSFDLKGVQFHPESVLTPQGREIIKNWMLQ